MPTDVSNDAITSGEPTEELANFICNLRFSDPPEAAIRLAERSFVDTVGVALVGASEGVGKAVSRFIAVDGATGGPATIIGRDLATSLTDAVLVNGTAAHGLDFDDSSPGMSGHPSVTMIPPLLAVGEKTGATGQQLLTGYIAGFETQCYLAAAILPEHYETGWHATATFGTFGATAATVSLLELELPQIRHALNIAASMAAGLKRNFGSMTKPIHAGLAARNGVTAALLASEGFTAAPDALGGHHGFLELYSGSDGTVTCVDYSLGDRWALLTEGINIKKYPCCYFSHTAITAVNRLTSKHSIQSADIEAIDVIASPGAGDALSHSEPTTGLEGKFSMEHIVACAIVRGGVDLDSFTDASLSDSAIQELRTLVTFTTDPELPYHSYQSTVTIETPNGTYSETVEEPPGAHNDPLTDAELRDKYFMCATQAIDLVTATNLYNRLDSLREVDETSTLLSPTSINWSLWTGLHGG